jgi:PEGA domain
MTRIIFVFACGLGLSACSGWVLNNPIEGGSQREDRTTSLSLESEPPGAQAQTSQGQSCRTPCTLRVPTADVMIVFNLPGYQNETITVRAGPSADARPDPDAPIVIALAPNPVFAKLRPMVTVAPVAESKPPPLVRKRVRTARPAPASSESAIMLEATPVSPQ